MLGCDESLSDHGGIRSPHHPVPFYLILTLAAMVYSFSLGVTIFLKFSSIVCAWLTSSSMRGRWILRGLSRQWSLPRN